MTGRRGDVITAAHLAAEAAVRLIRPGLQNMQVTDTIQKIARAFDTNSVEGRLRSEYMLAFSEQLATSNNRTF